MDSIPFPALKSKAVLAPLAGVTDVAFRSLARRYGAGLSYTEFVSSAGLVHGDLQSSKLLQIAPDEHPVGVQIFGNNTEELVAAAKAVEDRFDVIDLNCGCPAWKVIKTGAGSALLNDPARIGRLVKALVSHVSSAITIKIRTGIDHKQLTAVEVAIEAEAAGASAVTVHGRTQKQGFSGKADWNRIAQVKNAVSIPVIGNGDVTSPECFEQRLEESGVDAIMIGRGALNNPFLFSQINQYFATGTYAEKPSLMQYQEYISLAKTYALPLVSLKRHAMNFTKGLVGGARLRQTITRCTRIDDLQRCIHNFQKNYA